MDVVTKAELLERIAADGARFDEIVASVPGERLTEPALPVDGA
jgi:hypothetical protein